MKAFFKIGLLFFAFTSSSAEILVIDKVDKDEGVSASAKEQISFTPGEVYDVYTNAGTEKEPKLGDFVDSLFLAKVKGTTLVFADIWFGEKKYIKPGYLLVSTGRKMFDKGPAVATTTATSATANSVTTPMGDSKDSSKKIHIDTAFGGTFGLFDTSSYGSNSQIIGLVATLLTTRVGGEIDFRYQVSDLLSMGASAGIYSMQIEISGTKTTFYDLPLRGVIRFGKDGTYLQAHAGYMNTVNISLSGIEIGARGTLAGVYLEYSYLIGKTPWSKVGFGLNISDILNF